MPTLERTWTNSQNNVPADQTTIGNQVAYILLAMKNAFLSAGWAVTQSSNSITTSSGDLWTTAADVVFGHAIYSTAPHSWIILESPADYPTSGNQVYFVIEWTSNYLSGGTNYNCTFHTATADWTGGTTSTIGTTAGATQMFQTSNSFVPTSISNVKYHFSHNTIGDIIFYVSEDGGAGDAGFGLIISKLADFDASDNYPLFTYVHTQLNPTYGQPSPTYNAFGYNPLQTAANTKAYWIDGTSLGEGPAVSMSSNFMLAANGGDSNGDDITGNSVATTIYVCSFDTNKKAIRGRLVDMWMAGGTATTIVGGTVEPSTGPINLACITSVWLPADAVPSL
jgi:hypothetical protein